MSLEILFTPAFQLVRSHSLEPQAHRHLPMQVSFARANLRLESEGQTREGQACCIAPNVPHRVEADGVLLTYLVAPAHPVTQVLRQRLDGRDWILFETNAEALKLLESLPLEENNVPRFVKAGRELWHYHNLDFEGLEPLDERVTQAIDELDRAGSPTPSARELAELVSLSESRLMHLFKEELEFTLRAYRLWQKVLEACKSLARGSSVTEAAHAAGFTDAAHFASSFKKMFGVTLTQVFRDDGGPRVVFAEEL